MRFARPAAAGFWLAALVLAWGARPAGACTCSVPPLAQALAQAETAFVGTATAIDLDPEKENHVVTFTVQRVFKGSAPVRTQVVTPVSAGGCGFTFAPGAVYLVFTRNIRGKRLTHLCAGNVPSHLKGPWPRELETGWSPAAVESFK